MSIHKQMFIANSKMSKSKRKTKSKKNIDRKFINPISEATSQREKQYYADGLLHKEAYMYPDTIRHGKLVNKKMIPTENITSTKKAAKRAKNIKNRRDVAVSNYNISYGNIVKKSSSGSLLKPSTTHVSSAKDIIKLKNVDLEHENSKEDLKSSSSADTIPIKDKIVVTNTNKFKEFVDHNSKSNTNDFKQRKVKFSNHVPSITKSEVYRLRKSNEKVNNPKENASSMSSSTSFKNLNVNLINEPLETNLTPRNIDLFNHEEGTIDPELLSSDGNAINEQRPNFFSNETSAFSNEKNVFKNEVEESKVKKSLHIKELSELQMWPKITSESPKKPMSKNVQKYMQKVQKGLNTMDRLRLWRAIPNHSKYMEYYRNKKKYSNIQRSQYYLEIKNDVKRTYLHCSFSEESEAQNSLVRILSIYAMRNTEIGYVQGMNFLAGTLFLQ